MNLAEYARYDGLGLAELVAKKQVSPKELAQTALKAIEVANPSVNAVVETYPDRIAGPDIPLGARILAVANAVDAMVSGRPYRERSTRRLSPEEVRAELQRFAATQFDPEIVQAFLGLADEHPGLLQEDRRP